MELRESPPPPRGCRDLYVVVYGIYRMCFRKPVPKIGVRYAAVYFSCLVPCLSPGRYFDRVLTQSYRVNLRHSSVIVIMTMVRVLACLLVLVEIDGVLRVLSHRLSMLYFMSRL